MQRFLETFAQLNVDNLDRLEDIYTPDIRFIDPAHEIHGLPRLTAYFENLYAHITSIQFTFTHPIMGASEGYVQWHMAFRHSQIKSGRQIIVPGATFLKFASNQKVTFHRDYFDLGQMIYQHMPLVGRFIRSIKRRLGA